MENMYVNGELFIGKNNIIDFLITKRIDVFSNLPKNVLNSMLKKDTFFQLFFDQDNLKLLFHFNLEDNPNITTIKKNSKTEITIPITKEELESNFVSLNKILRESSYIGRCGKMQKPALNGDGSYMKMNNTIVLYKSSNYTIIYNPVLKLFLNKELPIEVLDFNYSDGWNFYGEQMSYYNDYKMLYGDIFKDVLNSRQKRKEKNKGTK